MIQGQKSIRRIYGFTLLEVVVVFVIFFILLQVTFLLAVNSYKYILKVSRTLDIKEDSFRVFSLIKKDLKLGGELTISSDNSQITIGNKQSREIRYYVENGRLYRSLNGKLQVLSSHRIADAVWVRNGNLLSIELTFSYRDFISKRDSQVKILENIEID